jgi:PKD repeat protein
MSDLTFLKCANFGETAKFTAQAGVTYYLQAGSYYGSSGILQLDLQELPRPVNDDFAKAALIPGPLPFDGTVNTQNATREGNEPRSACSYSSDPGTVWYAYTPTTSGSVSASIPQSSYMPVVVAVYTGNSLSSLTEAGCMTTYGGDRLTFRANTNTTYYLQLSNYHAWEQGEINLYLETAPPPVAVFDYAPFDPSTFDTIHFSDISYDPGYVNFESFTWDFGDGTVSTEKNPDHKYAKDGDYTVQHSVITFDGRTASTSQVVHVKTRDVAITKLSAPQSASAGQTRTITVSVSSKAYAETVQVDLYSSGPGGFVLVKSITQTVPAYNANRTVAYNFSYTFTSSDASIGKVTFYAVATIIGGRDIYPADNEAYSIPTRVNNRR